MTVTNKQLLISENRGDSNWCTPCREKPDQHATHFSRSVHVWFKTIRISRGPHIATFRIVINNDGQNHCSQEKGLPIQSIACWLIDPWVRTQFLSQASHWSSEGKATLCWRQSTRLTGPINTSMWSVRSILGYRANPSDLKWHTRGCNLGGAGLLHTTPQPFQPVVSTFHLRAPPVYSLTKFHLLNQGV
jgi:hypothetical protein